MPYRMQALITFDDEGEHRRTGDVFEVSSPAKAAALRYQRRADFTTDQPKDEAPKKGRYRRRDLRPEP